MVTSTPKKATRIMAVLIFLLLFTLAFSGNMRNTMMPQIREDYHITLSQIGFFNATLSIGSLVSSFIGGLIGDRFKKRTIIMILYPLYVALLFVAGTMPSFWILMIAMVLLGACSGIIMLMGNVFIAEIFPDKAKGLNLLHTIWAIGQFLAPMFVTMMFNKGFHWTADYNICAYVLVPVAIVFYIVVLVTRYEAGKGPVKETASQKQQLSYWKLLVDRPMLLLALVLFLQSNYQNSLMTWLPLYLTDHFVVDTGTMGIAVTLMWIGMTVGRIIYTTFSARINMLGYLKMCSIAASLITLGVILLNNLTVWMVASFALGALISGIYPNGVALTCEVYPRNAAAANSLVGISGNIGGMLMSSFIGMVAENLSFGLAMAIPSFMYLVAFILFKTIRFDKMRSSVEPAGAVSEG